MRACAESFLADGDQELHVLLPRRDRLVLGDGLGTELMFFDLSADAVVRRVTLHPLDTRR